MKYLALLGALAVLPACDPSAGPANPTTSPNAPPTGSGSGSGVSVSGSARVGAVYSSGSGTRVVSP
ncbi:hypothetical protein Q8W25_04420 [Shimia thalassica]|uniref:hypothetical protein n=1 Tax=Shimia thalassica TaxID=1715693 RepID=UPI002735EB0B|nr:hypothetical protein [Shimia thalassica]MDP2493247.1 hypothetical protein [Shimia thalassica]